MADPAPQPAPDTALPPDLEIDPSALREAVDGRWAYIRRQVREQLRGLLFAPTHGLDTDNHRQRVYDQIQALAASGMPRLGFPKQYGGGDDIGGSVATLELLAGDLSLMVKAGVQYGLFGGRTLAMPRSRRTLRSSGPGSSGSWSTGPPG